MSCTKMFSLNQGFVQSEVQSIIQSVAVLQNLFRPMVQYTGNGVVQSVDSVLVQSSEFITGN